MKETQRIIDDGMNSTVEKEHGMLSQGSDTSGLLGQNDNFNSGLGYGDNAMSSAIRNKYSQGYNTQMSGMGNKMQLDARNAHSQKILTAHNMASEEANLNMQKEMIKYKQKQMKKAQRGQIVGNVLGLVGSFLGSGGGQQKQSGG
jgi:hypothetical protein